MKAKTDLLNYLITNLQNEMSEIEVSLAEGCAINIESYHRIVGTYQGLKRSLEMIDEFLKEEKGDLYAPH